MLFKEHLAMDSEIAEIPDLGRGYKLGSLYDAVTGKFIAPQVPLGREDISTEHFDPPNDDYQLFPGNDVRKKFATLDTNSDLSYNTKLAILTGIIPAKSIAAFYTDQSSEDSNVQVTLRRTIETVKHIIKDPEAFAKARAAKHFNATHLIVSVTYGLISFTTFNLPRNPDEDGEDQQKRLESAVKSAIKHGKAARKDEVLDEVECRYYGDMKLPKRVTSFEDAVNVFIIQLAYTEKSENNTVPVRIGLLPLRCLGVITDEKPFNETTTKVHNEIFRVFEELNGAKLLAVELACASFCKKLPMYKEDFAVFVQSVTDYEDELKKQLKDVLPKTWAGLDNEKIIWQALKHHQASPFGEEQLTKWLDTKREEQDTLTSILVQLRQFPLFTKQSELNKKLNNVALRVVICLNLYEKVLKDNWVKVLRQFMVDNPPELEEFDGSASWHQNMRIKAIIRQEIATFLTLAEEHGNDPQKAFVVSVSSDKSQSLLKIIQYTDGIAGALSLNGKTGTRKDYSFTPDIMKENYFYQNDNPKTSALFPSVIPEMRYAEFLLQDSTPVPDTLPLVHDVQLKRTFFDQTARICRYEIGNRPIDSAKEKVVMLIGVIGPAKSRLINGVVNYMFNVKWDDPFRFRVILDTGDDATVPQTSSMTQEITAYTIHNQFDCPTSYSLTIVDMPGSDGSEFSTIQDQISTYDLLGTFFNGKGRHGLDHVDAVGIVVESSQSRLSTSQKFALDSLLSAFGNDIAGNIFLMVSSSDHQEPPVLAALNAANVPFNGICKFNSTALYFDNTDGESVAKWYWKIGQKCIGQFLTGLNRSRPKSLNLTKEVIRQQRKLGDRLLKLQSHIQTGLEKIDEICTLRKVIRQRQAEIMAKQDSKLGATFQLPSIGGTCCACDPCQCSFRNEGEKSELRDSHGCSGPNGHGGCGCGSEKSEWMRHIKKQTHSAMNKGAKTSKKSNKQKKNLKERTKADQLAVTKPTEELGQLLRDLQTLNGHLELMTNDVIQLLDATRECATRLDQIAVRSNPLTSLSYMDSLIEVEKQERNVGYEGRIAKLKEARKLAMVLDDHLKIQQFVSQAEKIQKSVKRQCEVGKTKYLFSIQ